MLLCSNLSAPLGDGGPSLLATMRNVQGLSPPDASGTVFVADTGNFVVRAITAAFIVSTVAGNSTSGYAGVSVERRR